MASKAERVAKTEKMESSGLNPRLAAIKYVNAGIGGLGLKPAEKVALQNKLIPLVEKNISLDRGRTASRAAGIAKREAKANVAKATKNIMGGK